MEFSTGLNDVLQLNENWLKLESDYVGQFLKKRRIYLSMTNFRKIQSNAVFETRFRWFNVFEGGSNICVIFCLS